MNKDQKQLRDAYFNMLFEQAAPMPAPPAANPTADAPMPPAGGEMPPTEEDPIQSFIATLSPEQFPDLLIALGESIKAQMAAEMPPDASTAGMPPEGAPPPQPV